MINAPRGPSGPLGFLFQGAEMEANAWFVATFTLMLICNSVIIFRGMKKLRSIVRFSNEDFVGSLVAVLVGWMVFTIAGLVYQFADPTPAQMESYLLSCDYLAPMFVIAITLNVALFIGGLVGLLLWIEKQGSWVDVLAVVLGAVFLISFGNAFSQQVYHPRFSPSVLKAKQKARQQYFEADPSLPMELPPDKTKFEKSSIVEENDVCKA